MNSPKFVFSSDKLELKSEDGNFFVEGYISTSDLDQVNDIVTKGCLMDMANQMKSRSIKFDVEHESFKGNNNLEREINKTIVPVAKVDDFLMDKKGIKVRAVLNKFAKRFNEVKGSIKEGFLDAFSIAYVPVKSVIEEKEGQKVRLLDKINLLNVAFTGNPVNTEAKMTNVFAKSLKFMEDKSNHNRASDKIKLEEVKMTEEKIESTESEKPEEKPEKEEKSEEVEEEKPEPEKEEKAEPEKPEESEKSEDLGDVKKELEEVKTELAEVKAILNKPVRKSKVEQKPEKVEEKSVNPLDLL